MRRFRLSRNEANETTPSRENNAQKSEKNAFRTLVNELTSLDLYSFGEPWQLTPESLSAVVPILKRLAGARRYLVIQEIPQERIKITDSGQIGKVKVEMRDVNKPVFVRVGTIFKGQGTQSRTTSKGTILDHRGESIVDVFCVHATHGISANSGLSTLIDVVPRKVEDVLTSPQKNQAKVWEAARLSKWRAAARRCPNCGSSELIQNYETELVCVKCGTVIPPLTVGNRATDRRCYCIRSHFRDDLTENLSEMTEFNQQIDKMLSKVPADIENQVGIVMIDSKGVYGLEMFDHPDSWRAFSKSVVRNYADVLARERSGEGLFALKTEQVPDAIKRFLQRTYNLIETASFKNHVNETRILSGELVGEYSTIESDVIHLILKRKTTE